MTDDRAGASSRAADRLLGLGALVGGACLVWTLLASVVGLTPLVVMSGSMSPAIGTGDLAVARAVPSADVRVGDVVSVVAEGGVRVTHRVEATAPGADGTTSLVLRGDANEQPDAAPYEVRTVDRVLFHVPALGRVVGPLSGRGSPLTLAGLGLVVAAVVIALGGGGGGGGGRGRGPGARHRDRGPRRRRPAAVASTAALVTTVVVAVGAVGAVRAAPTSAFFTDQATVPTRTLGAATLPRPVVACEDLGTTLRFRWTAAVSPLGVAYEVRLANGATVPVVVDGASRYVDVYSGLLSSLLGTVTTVSVVASPPVGPSAWSAVGRHDFTIALLGLAADCVGSPY